MRLVKLFFACVFFAVFATSCMTSPHPRPGQLYSDFKGPNQASPGKDEGKKTGQSCTSNVLGLVAWGDASIEAARAKGAIQNIATVDYNVFSLLGLYVQQCTLVTGA